MKKTEWFSGCYVFKIPILNWFLTVDIKTELALEKTVCLKKIFTERKFEIV